MKPNLVILLTLWLACGLLQEHWNAVVSSFAPRLVLCSRAPLTGGPCMGERTVVKRSAESSQGNSCRRHLTPQLERRAERTSGGAGVPVPAAVSFRSLPNMESWQSAASTMEQTPDMESGCSQLGCEGERERRRLTGRAGAPLGGVGERQMANICVSFRERATNNDEKYLSDD